MEAMALLESLGRDGRHAGMRGDHSPWRRGSGFGLRSPGGAGWARSAIMEEQRHLTRHGDRLLDVVERLAE